ncbi:MAG: GGDEF domain-containing protein [Gammaproteobacteria bacterium]|nr:GGDEF domain-containing protein [Gammaproteobacteria bacterium]
MSSTPLLTTSTTASEPNDSLGVKSMLLLKLPFFVEPDKQRFIQFVMKCLEMLNVSPFVGAAKLPAMLENISKTQGSEAEYSNLQLVLQANKLYLGTCDRVQNSSLNCTQDEFLLSLSEQPSEERIEEIREMLRLESEVSDPELLRQHNESIRLEMNAAKERAAQELLQLEQKLDAKRSQLQESIRAAEIDSLTQIYNRGAYDRRLEDGVKYCQRQGNPLSLIMLDLDYFKEVNDNLGHQAGDEVLKNMAKFMTQFTRKDVDHVCRMGGDEFAVICFAETEFAHRSAEKILQSMDNKVSIGIALLRADDTVESLISRTDEALYEAKERGRGQIVIDHELENVPN